MILHDLKAAAGSIAKESILRTQATNMDKKMFRYAYDPDMVFNMKFNDVDWNDVREPDDLTFTILDNLASRTYTGNTARDNVAAHAMKNGDLIKLICNKDLSCGVSYTTLNKVFGRGFIPKFQVQLAETVPIEDLSFPIVSQLKYNGVRVVAIISRSGVVLKTRNGKQFSYPVLEEVLGKIPEEIILDGELTDADNRSHTSVSGIVNSAIKGNPIHEYHDLVFNVFDCMTKEEFLSQSCSRPYILRYNDVTSTVNYLNMYAEYKDYGAVNDLVVAAETSVLDSMEQVQERFEEVLSKGLEGLILKQWDHLYTFKRSKAWIKLKDIKSADLRCVDVQAGTGKYEGMIGALVCEGLVEGQEVYVKVGSGLKDSDRTYDNDYVDKTIEVLYNSIIVDSRTYLHSLFLPRFVRVREDL